MIIVSIYKSGRDHAQKSFDDHFYILKETNTNILFWVADDEQKYVNVASSIQIWVRNTQITPTIHSILPEWSAILDGIRLPQGFYDSIRVAGRAVELLYQEYRFTCSFGGDPIGQIADIHPVFLGSLR